MGSWFFFALLAPLCWGFSNVLDGALRRHFIRDDHTLTWANGVLRWPIVLLLIALTGWHFPSGGSGWGMLLAGFLWTLMFIPYFQALHREETTRIALFLQMMALFTLILSFFMLGERLSLEQGLAFFFILIGGALAGLRRLEGIWRFSSAFWLMAVACFFWALSDVLFKLFEPGFDSFWNAFTVFLMGSALNGFLLLLSPSIRKRAVQLPRTLTPTAWVLLVLSIVVGMSGSMAFAYALVLGKVSLTTVFTESQTLFVFFFTLILAPFFKWVYREDLSPQALAFKGCALVFIGIGLVLIYV